jgi:acyl-CoA synthetase (AMP-forming)/AMP-acid ligase II/acyl carrier protein
VIIHGDEGTHTIGSEILKHHVTHMQCTPSLARMVALSPVGLDAIGHLQKLFVGGEALPLALVRHLRQAFSGAMYNMYGPTETTIWSTTWQIGQAPSHISVGKPIRNTQVYVLDSALQPVREGQAGDLFIGGDGVVRGYWRRPELSAERFLQNPFMAGKRIYRTGDIARFLSDGNLEFLGRVDFQVKLRGFRIEIEEIEATLEAHPGISQAVVSAVDFRSNAGVEDKRLVAYVTSKSGADLSVDGLRATLAASLPEYMVPSKFVILGSFPLTANGKVDRGALPKPTFEDEIGACPELPQTDLERTIAESWKDALGLTQLALDRNFFDLGAHSMMVAEVHMHLQQLLEREISLVDLFQFPTVSALAAHLAGQDMPVAASNRAEKRLAARKRRGV